jgi:diacylglycerol kinase (ATP)
LLERAVGAFELAGVECVAMLTAAPGHAAELAKAHAARYGRVFALGGDGTAVEVIGALAGTGIPVGILPGGTGNLLVRTLGIPLSIRKAVPALLQGEQAAVDLGVLGDGRHLAFSAGVGLDAEMIAGASAALKRRIGVGAYVMSAAAAVMRRSEFTVRAVVDGEAVERRASAVMVANFGTVLNDFMRLGPDIHGDDGLLDLCIFSPRNLSDATRIFRKLLRKDFSPDPCLFYRKGHRFTIETDPPQSAQSDGELIGSTPFTVDVVPLGGRLLLPAPV